MKKVCLILGILCLLTCGTLAEAEWIGSWTTSDGAVVLEITQDGVWEMTQNGNTLGGTWESTEDGALSLILGDGRNVPVEYKGSQILLMQTLFVRSETLLPEPTPTPTEQLSSLTPFDVKMNEDGTGLIVTGFNQYALSDEERETMHEIVVPAEIGGYPVTEIGGLDLPEGFTTVILPDSVTKLHESAFMFDDRLEQIRLSAALKEIGSRAFYKCFNLTSIELPEGLERIYPEAFQYTAISECHIPASVMLMRGNQFSYCENFTKITVDPANPIYRSIDDCILIAVDQAEYYGYEDYYIGDELVAVYGEAAKDYVIPENVYAIADYCFAGNPHLDRLTMHDRVCWIGWKAFSRCENLREITLSEELLGLGYSSFSHCTSLESITLPAKIEYIGQWQFEGCTNLKNVEITTDLPFSISNGAFEDCTSLESITLPVDIDEYDINAFINCTSLREITLLGVPQEYDCARYANIEPFVGCPSDMVFRAPEDEYLRELVESRGYTFIPLE